MRSHQLIAIVYTLYLPSNLLLDIIPLHFPVGRARRNVWRGRTGWKG
jgi:hypothetical protein